MITTLQAGGKPGRQPRFGWSLALAGLSSSVLSGTALGMLSMAEGHRAWQILNVSSQWLHGPTATTEARITLAHTGLGLLTHLGACFFWSLVALIVLRRRRVRNLRGVWIVAGLTGLAALILDYGILPARLSPGWHLLLSPGQVFVGFVVLAAGIGLGLGTALAIWRELRRRSHRQKRRRR